MGIEPTGRSIEVMGINVVPMQYLDPTAVLLHGQYDLLAAGILLVATVALVAASQAWFARKDSN